EDADKKTSKALIPLSDNASAAVHPSDPTLEKLNYIGGSNWQKSGETLVWNFTAETAGYYSLAASYRQNKILGGASYRHLKIDGETPFAEAQRIKFTYGYNWRCMNFTADGNNEKNAPYLIYLGAGPHTLSLSATAGEFSEIYAAMREITSALGDLYLDITTVTGETVDLYRSYNLFEQIPAFNDRIEENVRALATLTAKMEQIQNKKGGSQVSVLQSAAEILRQMRDHPYIAHRYKNAFYNAYTNLSAAMGGLADTPLDLDRIFLVGCGGTAPTVRPAFFTGVAFGAKRFLSSFFSDYSAVSDSEPDASLTIWVNWGRDQAKVLNTLIQDDFSAKQGVGVTVKVVNATLVQAILSGKGPDCILQTARSEPVNLAMRGALVDLSEFSDLEEVTGQFAKDASVPYQYKGGTYALPDTQNFYMMFIRNDIFSSFGLSPPETWEEFLETAAVLQRNNLQPSLPYTQITDSTIVNVGAGGLTLYPTLVLQNGLPLYSPDASQSTLTDAARIQIFSKWTEWYTKYKIPVVIDFYNRFRIGSAPIGIAPYTLYTQLKAAAPEIAGRWSVYPIPGTRREDGTVSRLSAGSGTGCAITQLSQNREEAWTFLKWWTSADTQIKYSDRLESLLGPLGRVAVSNTAAFEALGWEPETLIELRKQRGELAELPEVPGGYYLPRGIDQAFWNVTELNKIPADTLTEWGAVVDREIARKAREYN
ncbi:MAG: extracellular solute-binding protein, partial [Oscillospiraceae bacterium]|nr:extracellular solute-binding protein [Oscillospiraceae bacterium]